MSQQGSKIPQAGTCHGARRCSSELGSFTSFLTPTQTHESALMAYRGAGAEARRKLSWRQMVRWGARCYRRGIIESKNHRLEKTSKIIKSNHEPNTTMPTKPRPKVPHLHSFRTPPGMGTPPLPWAACSGT